MNTLHIAYKILSGLESRNRDISVAAQIGPAALKLDEADWMEVMRTLVDEGYVAGVDIGTDILGQARADVKRARITMAGAEYLHENSAMKKIAKFASDVITVAGPLPES